MANTDLVYIRCFRTGRFLANRNGRLTWMERRFATPFPRWEADTLIKGDFIWREGTPMVLDTPEPLKKRPDMTPRLVKKPRQEVTA